MNMYMYMFMNKTMRCGKIKADAELQPSSVRGWEDFTADFTFDMTTFSTIFNQISIYLGLG